MADIVHGKSLRGTDFERRHFYESLYGSSMLSHSRFANARPHITSDIAPPTGETKREFR
jgi:hypothetical protein